MLVVFVHGSNCSSTEDAKNLGILNKIAPKTTNVTAILMFLIVDIRDDFSGNRIAMKRSTVTVTVIQLRAVCAIRPSGYKYGSMYGNTAWYSPKTLR
jgi:hypothetical protein